MMASPADLHRPDDRELLRAWLRRVAEPGMGLVAFGGIVQGRRLEISEARGSRTRSLTGQRVSPGQGVGGRAMEQDRPVRVRDYFTAPTITHQFDEVVAAEGLASMVAIPVVVDRNPRAVLYAATRVGGDVGDHIIDGMLGTARLIGEELRMRDEVDRRISILQLVETAPASDVRDLEEILRSTHSELIALAHSSSDPELAGAVRALAARLEGRGAEAQEEQVTLSRREMDVLSQVALGCSYPEVGARLSLSPTTVKSYMRSVMTKLHCSSRVEAVATARRLRLLP